MISATVGAMSTAIAAVIVIFTFALGYYTGRMRACRELGSDIAMAALRIGKVDDLLAILDATRASNRP